MKFIDLFAGLGGFHQALTGLGHEAVFASEINPVLAELYEKNFGLRPYGDIRKSHGNVPPHDILCAGFPCQPFSKAGDQKGFECPEWGDLFDYVIKILSRHKPRFLMIENVPNVMRHDEGKTWNLIEKKLRGQGYSITSRQLSPHLFGIPQIRPRAIIVGCRNGLDQFSWPEPTHSIDQLDISSVLDVAPAEATMLPANFVSYLTAWQSFLDRLPTDVGLPSFPIWAMEFGATYPFEATPPSRYTAAQLGASKGSFGKSLKGMTKAEALSAIPSYARASTTKFPKWKVDFIRQNREFYSRHKKVLDPWLPTIKTFAPSFQKFEWNWKEGPRDLWHTIVQFRASGIRAKSRHAAPSLVALTTSQIPVIPWERRYMTVRECARLQSMGNLTHFPTTKNAAFKALGNAVNVQVMQTVALALFSTILHDREPKNFRPRANYQSFAQPNF
jgi:DNA (cytosine-5)-methyltransferase 1